MANFKKLTSDNRGSLIVSILVITFFLSSFIFGLMILSNATLTRAKSRVMLLQAQYSSESGADAALAILNSGDSAYAGTGGSEVEVLSTSKYRSTYTTSVGPGSDDKEKIITATGKVYVPATAATARYTRVVEVVAQRSSSLSTYSMLSRNILETTSSVKDVKGRDIFVNNYINLSRNTNNLIGEKITAGGKNTGATNCSVGGTGTLSKPTTFTDPLQTKTIVTVAFNNCISPPGNVSDTNFDVFANQTNIERIQSTLIPFSQYMNNTYSNADNCNDWATGASPLSIPSTGNLKKTHYPDSGSGVSSSCGTSGSLALGSNQYNITDHAHIRANLCSAAACSPTFNNPDSGAGGIKFIFIEGNVNFDAITTAPGSGPIVLVVYGADPASKASDCPLGGAFYLGNGTTLAPDLYIVATNGICLDKSKFSSPSALGGFSGKNIMIGTNSGTPHDLSLNLTFPVDSIPVDLTWRAARYRRL